MVSKVNKIKIKVEFRNGQFFVKGSEFGSYYDKGFGIKYEGYFILETYEVLYLFEKQKIEVLRLGEKLLFDDILKFSKIIFNDYLVYKDLRSKGYLIKSGLKYGVKFRVYNKGIKIGESHSLWLVEPISVVKKINFNLLLSKIRVSHSTKKDLVIAICDSENSITYISYNWLKF